MKLSIRGCTLMSREPLLLLSEDLCELQKSMEMDLYKGKGNRDGLVQQIITYIRDGHTVTRRQWVRSEFADHAKKNEEEKKQAMLREEEREREKHDREVEEQNIKARHQDERARKKQKKREQEELGIKPHKKIVDKELYKYKKQLERQRKKEEEERKKQEKKDKAKQRKAKKQAEHARYGQADQTRADNKAEERMATEPAG
jgi:hypothetical protein